MPKVKTIVKPKSDVVDKQPALVDEYHKTVSSRFDVRATYQGIVPKAHRGQSTKEHMGEEGEELQRAKQSAMAKKLEENLIRTRTALPLTVAARTFLAATAKNSIGQQQGKRQIDAKAYMRPQDVFDKVLSKPRIGIGLRKGDTLDLDTGRIVKTKTAKK